MLLDIHKFTLDEEIEYVKYLGKFMDEEDIYALKEVLESDLYYMIYLLAGKTIEFPSRVEMGKKIKSIRSRLYGKVKQGRVTGSETDN